MTSHHSKICSTPSHFSNIPYLIKNKNAQQAQMEYPLFSFVTSHNQLSTKYTLFC